ncbi:MAG: amidohydrolase family protein [bacterium]
MNDYPYYIDIHIHCGGPGRGKGSDPAHSYWSRKFTLRPTFWVMRVITGNLLGNLTEESVFRHISGVIKSAEYLKKAVLLAMDEVYIKGEPTPAKNLTHLYVSNEYVHSKTNDEKILFGASVHPYSPNALQRLGKCISQGAVLCKWIPSSMGINPADPLCEAFYEKLAYHNLPLLCHAGPEDTIPPSHKDFIKYDNPKYLRRALEIGVTVIAAHCALPYLVPVKNYFTDLLRLFEIEKKLPGRIYADISAFCSPTRLFYIKDLLQHIPPSRLLYGSDYPIPILSLSRLRKHSGEKMNPLDRNYLVTRDMGFSQEVFASNFERLIEKITR